MTCTVKGCVWPGEKDGLCANHLRDQSLVRVPQPIRESAINDEILKAEWKPGRMSYIKISEKYGWDYDEVSDRCKKLGLVRKSGSVSVQTKKSVTTTKTLRVKHEPSQEIESLKAEISVLKEEIKNLGPIKEEAYEFWMEPEAAYNMSLGIEDSSDKARLFGAIVPSRLLDAIWYCLSTNAKSRLLSAIAVARFKEKP